METMVQLPHPVMQVEVKTLRAIAALEREAEGLRPAVESLARRAQEVLTPIESIISKQIRPEDYPESVARDVVFALAWRASGAEGLFDALINLGKTLEDGAEGRLIQQDAGQDATSQGSTSSG